MFRRIVRYSVIAFAVAVLPGCGSGSSLVDTAPVAGVVTLDGKPLANAQITFKGNGGLHEGGIAIGTTDESGRYTLRTHTGPRTEVDGAVPGGYTVGISKLVPPKGMQEADYQRLVDEVTRKGEDGTIVPDSQLPPPRVQLVSPRFSNLATSTLKVVVEHGKKNTFDFEVK